MPDLALLLAILRAHSFAHFQYSPNPKAAQIFRQNISSSDFDKYTEPDLKSSCDERISIFVKSYISN